MPPTPLPLDFSLQLEPHPAPNPAKPSPQPAPTPAKPSLLHEDDDIELPPTWSENSPIFHTTEKCTRLQSIRRNRRITGNPGLRQHCLNCLDITATKRRG